jgi:hypothetical protein
MNSGKTDIKGTWARRAKKELKNSDLQGSAGAITEPVDYPFTTSDLELRSNSLRQALDLRATVLRVK